jgi:hypothetical protein
MTWVFKTRGPGHVLIDTAAYEALCIFRISYFVGKTYPLSVCSRLFDRMSAERPSTPPRQNAAGPGQLPRGPLTPEQKRKMVRFVWRTPFDIGPNANFSFL